VVNPNEFRNLVRSFDDLKEEVKRGKKENDEKMRRIVEEQRMGANRRGPQQQDIAAAGQMVKQSIESAHIVPMNIKLDDVQQRQRAMNGQISALARELGEYKQGMKVQHMYREHFPKGGQRILPRGPLGLGTARDVCES
jgi:uncharacterized protein YpuA (DUF1002 family)